jgi:hypothetical protein
MKERLSAMLSHRYAPPLGLVLAELVLFVAITTARLARRA